MLSRAVGESGLNFKGGIILIDPLFKVHTLNNDGIRRAASLALAFNGLLEELRVLCPENTREFSIVKTKLEEACFFAKKSIANLPENQEEKAAVAG